MLKRIFDILVSILALVIISPLFIIVALAEKVSGEEVFFKQERVGQNLRTFWIYKFTTMPKGSEKLGSITTINDRRLTKLGRFLRKYKINELPQLLNVIKGEMSFVGPRPLLKEHAEIYDEDVRKKIYSVKPGLTGWGSIHFHQEDIEMDKLESKEEKEKFYREVIMPKKAELELWYVENRSILLDIKIIILTALRFVNRSSRSNRQQREV